MIHLGRLSLAGTGIVCGGLLLGSALASFANPLPKAPEPAPWEGTLHPRIAVGEAQPFAYSMPEELYPRNLPAGYAPAVAFTEMKWPAGFGPRYADPAPLPALHDRAPADDTADFAEFDERPVAIPHYAAIERAAQQQQPVIAEQQQADDGQPVAADQDPAALTMKIDPASPPPLPAGEAHVIHISDAG